MKTVAINFLLLLVAITLLVLLSPVGMAYTLIRSLIRLSPGKAIGYLSNVAKSVAFSIDLAGNVICRDLFNDILRHPDGHSFGDPRESISSVLGKNKAGGNNSDLGRALASLLNWIHTDHVELSADATTKKLIETKP